MNKEIAVNISFGKLQYKLEAINTDKGSFWAICGSKKGSCHSGGGIIITDLQFLNEICCLIDQIALLKDEAVETETKVSFFSHRNRVICGETRRFKENNFYRIKEYVNYFVKDGDINYYKQHRLKPAGRGFFIQEFDFPISSSGVKVARDFSQKLRETIEHYLTRLVGNLDGDTLNLIRNEQVLIGGEPPWLKTDMSLETVIKHNALHKDLCEKLLKEPLTTNQLAIHLGITPDAGKRLLNTASRYNPRFFEQGFLLDRVHKGFDSLHYLITQIPKEALEESPTLTCLFEEDPPGKWPDWISATFSNDEYSVSRNQSYHFANFEIEAFEGGLDCGLAPELHQMRALAIRLFDLRRHFQSDESAKESINALIKRFVTLTKETNHA